MIIVISSAKKLDFSSSRMTGNQTLPQWNDMSAALVDRLRLMSPVQLSQLMKVSPSIAELNFERYMQWQAQPSSATSRHALFAFAGDVYRGLEAHTLTGRDVDFAQEHLRIISGLYGLLRPLDLIQPYRLDMGARLEIPEVAGLYAYWSEAITTALNGLLATQQENTLVNLASREYFRAIDVTGISGRIITPVFKEFRKGKYSINVPLTKRARGMMARYIIENRLEISEQIKSFNEGGYMYDESLSSENEWIFSR